MSKEDLKALIEPLSTEDKLQLRSLLDDEIYEAAFEQMQLTNPLKGSVLHYPDPFGPACEPSDWEVAL